MLSAGARLDGDERQQLQAENDWRRCTDAERQETWRRFTRSSPEPHRTDEAKPAAKLLSEQSSRCCCVTGRGRSQPAGRSPPPAVFLSAR